jgi:two-component system nitrogen regulation response regulator GlnG
VSETSSAAGFRKRLEELLSEARRAGAADSLKPVLEEALAALRPVASKGSEHELPIRYGMVGRSPAMNKVFGLLDKVVPSEVAVLIQGETGTGKELVARALHEYGPRKGRPFLAENCAAVPADLLESELFGHKKGSFTGAIADRPGHFVAADGGTVFLDEIGDMPLPMQSKLLRVLQEGEVRPVGSNKVIKVDVRIVAASNKDLHFRLNVITVQLPPLRERAGDVRLLARFYLEKVGAEMGRKAEISGDALTLLESWRWPGNVRELENEIRRALALSPDVIGPADLSAAVRGAATA